MNFSAITIMALIAHCGSSSHSAVYVLLSLNVASIIYCFEDSDEHKMSVQEADYREDLIGGCNKKIEVTSQQSQVDFEDFLKKREKETLVAAEKQAELIKQRHELARLSSSVGMEPKGWMRSQSTFQLLFKGSSFSSSKQSLNKEGLDGTVAAIAADNMKTDGGGSVVAGKYIPTKEEIFHHKQELETLLEPIIKLRELARDKDKTLNQYVIDNADVQDYFEGVYIEPDVTIFFCLSRPAPNKWEENVPKNVRWYVKEIVANGHYQTFLLLTILASTIQLLLESPIKSQSIITESSGLLLNWTFLGIFFTEFLLKALLHGIYWSKLNYQPIPFSNNDSYQPVCC